MLQHERHRCARDQRTVAAIDDIASEILAARDLVRAGTMAVQQLPADERNALASLLDAVATRLAAIAETTERVGQQAGTTDAA